MRPFVRITTSDADIEAAYAEQAAWECRQQLAVAITLQASWQQYLAEFADEVIDDEQHRAVFADDMAEENFDPVRWGWISRDGRP